MKTSTNFSQNLEATLNQNKSCRSNYHGKRYVHKQNLETKNQILINLLVFTQKFKREHHLKGTLRKQSNKHQNSQKTMLKAEKKNYQLHA